VIRTAWAVLRIKETIEGMRKWFQSKEFAELEIENLKEWNPEFLKEAIGEEEYEEEYEEAA